MSDDEQHQPRWKRVLGNPATIIAIAGAFGVSGDQIQTLMSMDVPGWVAAVIAGALPVTYATAKWGKSQLDTQREMVSTIKLLRDDVQEVRHALAEGSNRFQEHGARLDSHDVRLNEAEAWIEAHREKTRRETGKLGK